MNFATAASCNTQQAKIDAGKNRTPACLRKRKWDNRLYYKMTAGSIPGEEYYPKLGKKNTEEGFGKPREH